MNRDQLKEKWGDLIPPNRPFAISINNSWADCVDDCLEEMCEYLRENGLDRDSLGINQIKSKFGTLRLYFFIQDPEEFHDKTLRLLYDGLNEIVYRHEKIVNATCSRCGNKNVSLTNCSCK